MAPGRAASGCLSRAGAPGTCRAVREAPAASPAVCPVSGGKAGAPVLRAASDPLSDAVALGPSHGWHRLGCVCQCEHPGLLCMGQWRLYWVPWRVCLYYRSSLNSFSVSMLTALKPPAWQLLLYWRALPGIMPAWWVYSAIICSMHNYSLLAAA